MKDYHKAAELLRELAELIGEDESTTRKVWAKMEESPFQRISMLRADMMMRAAENLKMAAHDMEQLQQ